MKDEFAGRVAVVTGAAQGIGLAIACELRARGARILLVDRNASRLAKVAQTLDSSDLSGMRSFVADLSDPAAIEDLASQVSAAESRIDVLVNNAGIEIDLPFEKINVEIFNQVIAVNLRAPLLMTQALFPLFPSTGGAIVNISSIHANHAFPNAIPYACSKAGLLALTRNLALELAPRNIRVNAICPGYIDTPMWEEWLRGASNPAALAEETEKLHPLGRRGLPQDVAMAVAYLAGPQSPWITGTSLVVDGGLTVRAHP
ncbi:MAG: SDR family oxidoreductase [Acidobacteriota bacterium]|nr:SDR family oxidoreductase [Acidobacteriota bacterium]